MSGDTQKQRTDEITQSERQLRKSETQIRYELKAHQINLELQTFELRRTREQLKEKFSFASKPGQSLRINDMQPLTLSEQEH